MNPNFPRLGSNELDIGALYEPNLFGTSDSLSWSVPAVSQPDLEGASLSNVRYQLTQVYYLNLRRRVSSSTRTIQAVCIHANLISRHAAPILSEARQKG